MKDFLDYLYFRIADLQHSFGNRCYQTIIGNIKIHETSMILHFANTDND